ncbi:hypothetical protein SEPCBS119000_002201 [Sporothrix epigloea]|uniref:CUE domain-containing protein n=1 Tax=Sporothrix epigloea TaxID=1892477 RepID=A0ABP0DGI3_9PEZI
MADEINVPSLVLVLVVSGFLIRHFFFRASPQSSGERGVSENGARGASGLTRAQRRAEALDRRIEAAVEHIQQIFPYADRREVWWDLRLNGINVAATTERIISGGLDAPPITFQPPMPPSPPSQVVNSGTAAGAASSSSTATRPSQPSLIQRYNLESRVAETHQAETASSVSSSAAGANNKARSWSTSKDERHSLLQKRRDDMILEARRKMEAKIAAEQEAAALGKAKSA